MQGHLENPIQVAPPEFSEELDSEPNSSPQKRCPHPEPHDLELESCFAKGSSQMRLS
jgi:hypothetical protein